MNPARLALAGLAATLVYYVYGFLVFGLLIAEPTFHIRQRECTARKMNTGN